MSKNDISHDCDIESEHTGAYFATDTTATADVIGIRRRNTAASTTSSDVPHVENGISVHQNGNEWMGTVYRRGEQEYREFHTMVYRFTCIFMLICTLMFAGVFYFDGFTSKHAFLFFIVVPLFLITVAFVFFTRNEFKLNLCSMLIAMLVVGYIFAFVSFIQLENFMRALVNRDNNYNYGNNNDNTLAAIGVVHKAARENKI